MDTRQALPNRTGLADDYEIKGILGAGGFGVTYVAREKPLDRDVAIKEYFPSDFASRDGVARLRPKSESLESDYQWGLDRFVEEAKTLAKFNHANIVRVYRYFLANDTAYMVLHFEEGRTFKHWLEKLGRKPTELELVSILHPLLNALELIHEHDFLHRDITPDNIMIRPNGTPVLIDFGSARGQIALGSKTVSALIKPGYSPFEQYAVSSKDQGPWTDIYSLGATLYQAVTGRRPADAPSRMVQDELVPAIECGSGYSPEFLKAIDKSLLIPVKARPQTVAQWRKLFQLEAEAGISIAQPIQEPAGAVEIAKPDFNRDPEPQEFSPEEAKPRKKASKRKFKKTVKLEDSDKAKPPVKAGASLLSRLNKVNAEETAKKTPKQAAKKKRVARKKTTSDSAKKKLELNFKTPAIVQKFSRPKFSRPKFFSAKKEATPLAKVQKPEKVDNSEKKSKVPAPVAKKSKTAKKFSLKPKVHILTLSLLFLQFTGAVGIASAIVYFHDLFPGSDLAMSNRSLTDPSNALLISEIRGHREAIKSLAYSKDSLKLVSGSADDSLRIWDLETNRPKFAVETHSGDVTAIAVNEQRIVSADSEGKVILTDLESGKQLNSFQKQTAEPTSVAFTGYGDRFITAGSDATVRLWDGLRKSSRPRTAFKAHSDPITDLAYSKRRGYFLTASADNTIKLWLTSNRKLVRTYRGHSDSIDAIAVSPSGKFFATASKDRTIKLWSSRSKNAIHTLEGHKDEVNAVAFSPNGEILVSGSSDKTVALWNLKTGRNLVTFNAHHGAVNSVAFSGDGKTIATGGDDSVIRLWKIPILQ